MSKTTSLVKHLKLITGEELVCELMSETGDSLIIRNALSLIEKDLSNGGKYYAFKTFMVYQDSPQNVMIVFFDKIMSVAVPTEEMYASYGDAIKEMNEYNEEQELKKEDKDEWDSDLSLEEFLNEMDRNNDFMDSDVEGMIKN
jgi:hypothetical protein